MYVLSRACPVYVEYAMVNCLDNGQGYPESTAEQVRVVSVTELLLVLYQHKYLIGVVCLGAMVAAGICGLRSPRMYEATASIVPPLDVVQREAGLSGRLGLGGKSLLSDIVSVGGVADMYVGILRSWTVIDAVVDRFGLMERNGKAVCRTDARMALAGSTTVAVSREGIVRITVKDGDPNRPAAIANAYVEELDMQNKRLSASQATSKRVFLENRLKEVEAKLSKIDNILSREAKTQEMLYQLLVEQYEMAKMEEVRSMPTIQVLDPATVPEKPLGRGTVRKTFSAGFAAFAIGAFAVIVREGYGRMMATRRHSYGRHRDA